MPDRLTEAELIQRLQLIREHGSLAAAARVMGMSERNLAGSVAAAKALGLTADSKITDETARLKAQLKLNEVTIKNLQREADTAEAIRKAIYGLAEHTPEPPEWLMREGKPGSRGAPCTIWSDWHWGEVISKDEVGGVNEFNIKIAKARAKRLVETTIALSFEHMGRANTKYPGVVVMLGGDFLGGDIHEELAKTNDRTPQQAINDLTDTLAACLDNMAAKFGKVFVPCVVGNHGRSTKKMQMKQRVFTSYEWNVYCNLERYFCRTRHIQFMIPSEADATFSVFGHRYLLTHGDSLGVKGGDGIIGALGPIMRGALKTSKSEAQIGRQFDTLVIGHWHQMLWLPNVIVNNSFKGYDEYARLALRATYSRPSQALWFSHPEHGITARWEVFLEGRRQAAESKDWIRWPDAALGREAV
jgi:hypothetical protein